MKVLVVNAGSSSIKYQVFDMTNESVLCKGLVDRVGFGGSSLKHEPTGKDSVLIQKDLHDHTEGMELALEVIASPEYGVVKSMDEIQAIGHRVLTAGSIYSESIVIDSQVKQVIRDCFDIGPLHNPANLMGIEACQALMPAVPNVAVFDTAFQQTMEPGNYLYGIPYEAYEKFKVRKYGFHGTSHYYVSHRAADMLGKPFDQCKIITLHLGNGASSDAVKNGKVVDTSMGLTPLEGFVMGTRSGDLDPAVVWFLMDRLNMNAAEAETYFNKKSGLLGLSGVSNDLRDVLEAAASGHERAKIAMDVYYNRIKGYVGNYIAKMNGTDCIAFTAGVGENSAEVRENICKNMEYLGIKLDPVKNNTRGKEVEISAEDSKVKIFIIPTNEELVIARDTLRLCKL